MADILQTTFSNAFSDFLSTLRLRQNGSHFTDDTFKHLNENVGISI